jgi:hypothetical protein
LNYSFFNPFTDALSVASTMLMAYPPPGAALSCKRIKEAIIQVFKFKIEE